MSAGVTIGCAMEMAQRGIVDSGVKFGDIPSLMKMIENIAYRRGFGDALAEGSRRFSEKYGVPEYAMQVKGMELPAYEPRAMACRDCLLPLLTAAAAICGGICSGRNCSACRRLSTTPALPGPSVF